MVYEKLDIKRASSLVLDIQMLLASDMDQLKKLIGLTFQLPSREHLDNYAFDIFSASGNFQYFTCKNRGLSVLLEESTISAIFLYSGRDSGYSAFPHKLSADIRFGDRRSRIRKALGKPSRADGIAYGYAYPDKDIRFEFREWLGTLKMVVISQPYRPEW